MPIHRGRTWLHVNTVYTLLHRTAPEESDIQGGGMPYCPPSQLTVPLFLKWALVWDQPDDSSVWLGRAAPREMVAHKDGIAVVNVPTQYGRVSFSMKFWKTELKLGANLTLPKAWQSRGMLRRDDVEVEGRSKRRVRTMSPAASMPPPGGLYLRGRLPSALGLEMTGVAVNGLDLPEVTVDATSEIVHFPSTILQKMDLSQLVRVEVTLQKQKH